MYSRRRPTTRRREGRQSRRAAALDGEDGQAHEAPRETWIEGAHTPTPTKQPRRHQ